MDFRHAIHHLHQEEHLSERDIARHLGLSPSVVHYWASRQGVKSRSRSGRPRVTDVRTDQNLYEASCKDPFLTAVDLQKSFVPGVSVDTVRNRLKQRGLKCRIPARKPFLSQFHREGRFIFAQNHHHWTLDDWDGVVFSDEKVFKSSSRGALRVYRPVNTSDRYDDQYLVHSTNPSQATNPRFTLCVWMAFGGRGKVRQLHRIEQRTLNADYYTTHILPTIEEDLCENQLIFMQDLSSIHTSHKTRQWLQEHNITLMDDWPPKGPDMNPVENVWAELVRQLEVRHRTTGVRNRDQLWEDILSIFHALPDSYFDTLILSMPRRVHAVTAKRGGWTKY